MNGFLRWALLSVVAIGVAQPPALAADSYLPPGTPEVGGVRHLVLIYAGAKSRVAWDAEKLLPYVSYVDRQGRPRDWFFDSFLWLELSTNAGLSLWYQTDASHPAVKADWNWVLDVFFDPAHGVGQLEAAMRKAAESLPDQNRRINLVIAMPMPQQISTNFGAVRPGGPSLNFTRDADRVAATEWYVREAMARWKKINAPHVRLAGFYFLRESIEPNNREMVRQTADLLHSLGMKLYWIPYFGAESVDLWRQLGIDGMMCQPNYAFDLKIPPDRLAVTARLAKRINAGLEVEIDGRAVVQPEYRPRYLAYLDAGVKYGFMNRSLLGYYQADDLLLTCAASRDPEVRNLYDQTYRFVRGTYRPRGDTPLPALDAAPAAGSSPPAATVP